MLVSTYTVLQPKRQALYNILIEFVMLLILGYIGVLK